MGRTIIISVKILPTEYDAFFRLIGKDVEFPRSYDWWLKRASEEDAKCRSRGDIINQIEVHPKEFTAWSRSAGLDPSFASLRGFAVAKASRKT